MFKYVCQALKHTLTPFGLPLAMLKLRKSESHRMDFMDRRTEC